MLNFWICVLSVIPGRVFLESEEQVGHLGEKKIISFIVLLQFCLEVKLKKMYVILHHNKEKQYLAKKFVSNCIFFEELIKVSVIKCTNLLTQTIVSKYT